MHLGLKITPTQHEFLALQRYKLYLRNQISKCSTTLKKYKNSHELEIHIKLRVAFIYNKTVFYNLKAKNPRPEHFYC